MLARKRQGRRCWWQGSASRNLSRPPPSLPAAHHICGAGCRTACFPSMDRKVFPPSPQDRKGPALTLSGGRGERMNRTWAQAQISSEQVMMSGWSLTGCVTNSPLAERSREFNFKHTPQGFADLPYSTSVTYFPLFLRPCFAKYFSPNLLDTNGYKYIKWWGKIQHSCVLQAAVHTPPYKTWNLTENFSTHNQVICSTA